MKDKTVQQNIAANIVLLRQARGMTQADLADRLHYTDKAVSRWERAETLPDVVVLKQVADILGVTVDALLQPPAAHPLPVADSEKPSRRNKRIITLLSVAGVWLLVLLAYLILQIVGADRSWLAFVWGAPATAADLLVFTLLWYRYSYRFWWISALLWTGIAALYITLAFWTFWYPFLLAVPLQAAVLFWSAISIKRAGNPGRK